MNAQALRSKVRTREVSERKQVGDAESLINAEPYKRITVTQPRAGLLRRSAILVGVSPITYSIISDLPPFGMKAPRTARPRPIGREDTIDHAGKGLPYILYNIHTLFPLMIFA
ncbi:hypothetical protein VTN00DRAFT_1960 [Thermoascus crustaceus]|uniref:uncharacterized protein n=1 Tax=Thermoascus crustaceus TaxID=5088 RepID=UPI0037430FB4